MITATRNTGDAQARLTRFGFSFEKGGAHSSRTMMLRELQLLLSVVNNPNAHRADYTHAIEADNCLRKRSGKTRSLTARHLIDLYSLDPALTIFRTLLFFWERDEVSQPLLALLCAYSRDALLRLSAALVLEHAEGSRVYRAELEGLIEDTFAGRFSPSTLKSTAQNINATWTNSGHLVGKAVKVRKRAVAGIGAVSYALLLGYLNRLRGEALFESEYMLLLDCPTDRAIDLTAQASQRGWLVFKRLAKVMEISFPDLLTEQEVSWTRE